jgi:hypothetical protein
MSKPYKLLLFTIILAAVSITIIVYRYEQLLGRQKKEAHVLGSVLGGTPSNKQYTATEIIELIKKSKEYIGDSVTIFDNGDVVSSNGKFQGTIKAVLDSKDNMDIVYNNAKTNKLPLQYNVYVLAAIYYRQQYASEFEKQ